VTRLLKWIIGVALVLVVLISAGTFVYIHFIEGDAPKPLTLNDASSKTPSTTGDASSSAAPAQGATGVAGTWNVHSSDSTVGYRVEENLFGQKNTAVGRTNAVTGNIVISGTSVTSASFTADMTKVSSDRQQRDNQFQGRIMDTSTYPKSTFASTAPISIAPVPAAGKVVSYKATGKLTMHGTTKTVTFTLNAKRDGTNLDVQGSIPVKFADWNIPNPSFGPVSTQDHGVMEFLLVLRQG
jgi:polyisoprenoid-binding protein YceI